MLSITRSKNSGGFTLIELLVVIAIISMLMSIMMPSLRKAKEQSRQAVCMTNLHNLFLGWEMYSQNNDYKLVPPFTGGSDGNLMDSWVNDGPYGAGNPAGGTEYEIRSGLLWPHVGDIKVYKCPSDRSDRFRSYALSFAMGGRYNTIAGPVGERDGIVPITRLPKTSGKLVFVDSEPSCPCSNKWIRGSFIPFEAEAGVWARFNERSDLTNRHSNGCNACFADGSTLPWKWQDIETIEFANNKSEKSKPAASNPDFRMIKNSMNKLR